MSSAGQDIGLIYTERRCALRWPLLVAGLLATVAGAILVFICLLFGFVVSKAYFAAEVVALYWTFFWVRLLRSRWPTGIRVDAAGIRIGDMRALPFATSQSFTVFTCPWAAVRRIVVTESASLRSLVGHRSGAAGATRGRRPGWRSRGGSPLTRAVIVLYVDPDAPGGPQARGVGNVYPVGTPPTMWLAPTRRPRALRAALAQVPDCPPVADYVDPDTA
jgi:hypothetical protein